LSGFLFLLFLSSGLLAQSRTVTGTVSDAHGTLAGVAVQVLGTGTGTTSDAQGNYRIQAAAGQTIQFSFLGYETKLEPVGTQTVIDVVMAESATDLDEVVVIGYGTVRKRDLTGSVASVKSDVIAASPSINAINSLGGRISGVDISDNLDPDKVEIRIRGTRSISGKNDPLFIIDGVQGGSYNDINPNDIESVEVLKDASSTAIYGSQGANGVIIITTKKGRIGKPVISYNGFAGVEYLSQHPDYRQGENYVNALRDAGKGAGIWSSPEDDRSLFDSDTEYNAYQNDIWTNYEKLTMQNSLFQSHNLTVSGGNERTTARFSAGYYGNKNQYRKGKTERYTLRMNIDHKVSDWVTTGVIAQVTHNVEHISPYQGLTSSTLRIANPIELGSPWDADGNVLLAPLDSDQENPSVGYLNPLINGVNSSSKVNEKQGTNVMTNGFVNLAPVEGLNFRSSFGANMEFKRTGSFTSANTTSNYILQRSSSSLTNENKRFLNWDNVISYNKAFEDHAFGVTALTSWIKSIDEKLVGTGNNQIVDEQLWWSLQGNASVNATSNYIQYQSFSYAARFNYSFKDRYLLTGSIRWDGASRLDRQWAAFPSVALAWRISDEPFVQRWDVFDNLKLRASYGRTGNSGIEPYGTQSGVTAFNNNRLAFQDTPVLWYLFTQAVGNKQLGWEKTSQVDVGLDFTILKGRLSGTIDYYDSKTKDLLIYRTLPSMMGQGVDIEDLSNPTKLGVFSIYQNIGRTSNKGIEIELHGLNIQSREFHWSTTLTFSANKERITALQDGLKEYIPSTDQDSKSLMVGRPIKSYRGYILDGIWQSSEAAEAAQYFRDSEKTLPFEPGMIKLRDLNGDHVIDNSEDYTYLGSQTPKWFAGLNNTFRYKDFDFSIYAYIRWGHWGDNKLNNYDPRTGGRYVTYNYWTPERETNDFPAADKLTQFTNYHGYTAYQYIDRSFFRIKNMTLGYTLPEKAARAIGLNNLRVYATGSNLWFKNKHRFMKKFDPEGLRRQVVFGLNFEF